MFEEKKDADGGIMPMSMSNAVMSASYLHKKYSEYMSNKYTYDRDSYNVAESADLIARENDLAE